MEGRPSLFCPHEARRSAIRLPTPIHPDPVDQFPFPLLDQRSWAEAIGRKVARSNRLIGQEENDIIADARAMCVDLYRRTADGRYDPDLDRIVILSYFDMSMVPVGGDPEGAFRGWAHQFIEPYCIRCVKRLRNAGTYHTTRPEHEPAAIDLGDGAEELKDSDDSDESGIEYLDVLPVSRTPRLLITDDLEETAYGRHLACGRKKRLS